MENNQTPPAKTLKPIATLPYRSQQIDDPEANYDVSVWRSEQNLCEFAHEPTACDTLSGLYYGSAEDEVTKFCPRHFYGMHLESNVPYRLVEQSVDTGGGQTEQAPQKPGPPIHPGHYESWLTPEAWAAARADSQWVAEREAAKMRDTMHRYPQLHAEQKIRLAMGVLYDVLNTWDDDNLAEYPEDMPAFEEYLAEIGEKLYDIRWNHD